MKLLALVLLLSITAAGHGQSKQGIKFDCTCTDTVGARYALAMRDVIATSPRYRAATDFVEGPENQRVYNVGLLVVSLDPQSGHPGNGSALSVVITWGAIYMTSYIQICPSGEVQTCAMNTMASLDAQVLK